MNSKNKSIHFRKVFVFLIFLIFCYFALYLHKENKDIHFWEQPKFDPKQKLDLRFYSLLAISVYNLNIFLDKLNKANSNSDVETVLDQSQNLLK
jgi:hypothetical protein